MLGCVTRDGMCQLLNLQVLVYNRGTCVTVVLVGDRMPLCVVMVRIVTIYLLTLGWSGFSYIGLRAVILDTMQLKGYVLEVT